MYGFFWKIWVSGVRFHLFSLYSRVADFKFHSFRLHQIINVLVHKNWSMKLTIKTPKLLVWNHTEKTQKEYSEIQNTRTSWNHAFTRLRTIFYFLRNSTSLNSCGHQRQKQASGLWFDDGLCANFAIFDKYREITHTKVQKRYKKRYILKISMWACISTVFITHFFLPPVNPYVPYKNRRSTKKKNCFANRGNPYQKYVLNLWYLIYFMSLIP